MTTRFKNALDALVYAFFNDTLAKGKCTACAVGNIVANGFKKRLDPRRISAPVFSKKGFSNGAWILAFGTENGKQYIDEEFFHNPKVVACISATGYSIQHMIKVEYAFETNTTIFSCDYLKHTKEEIMQDQYNGLCVVVDVLCKIEGIEDPTEYKELFAMPA